MTVAIFCFRLASIEAQYDHLLRDIAAFRLQRSSCKRLCENVANVKFSSKFNNANAISQFKLI